MKLRFKFTCDAVTERMAKSAAEEAKVPVFAVRLYPVADCLENRSSFAIAPNGLIDIAGLCEQAGCEFEPGRAYFIEFTPAD